MMQEIEKLAPSEAELLLKAPLLVCILIAGADNDIDRKEIKKAIQFAQQKQMGGRSNLIAFYQLLSEDFEDKLKVLIQSFPSQASERGPLIVSELSNLNEVLKKINYKLAIEFYRNLREVAQKTAESSGGLLGLKSIGDEEKEYMDLPMLKDPTIKK